MIISRITNSRRKVYAKRISKNFFSTKTFEEFSRKTLQDKTVAELKEFAKASKINLRKTRSKAKIVDIIFSHGEMLQQSTTSIEVIENSFDIVADDRGYINVSLWFKGKLKSLDRCIKTKRFQELLAQYIEKEKPKRDDILVSQGQGEATFLPPILAIFVASHLNKELHYDILQYYLFSKVSQIEMVYRAEIASLKQDNEALELGLKLNRLSWVNFEVSYAYYWFMIGDTLKCGVVGIKDNANEDNLKKRLSTHRTTYAKLRLLGCINFKDSQTLLLFENWMKTVLSDYCIDGTDSLVEQYQSKSSNIEEIADKLIREQFLAMRAEERGLGSFCSQNLIDRYNEISKNRFS